MASKWNLLARGPLLRGIGWLFSLAGVAFILWQIHSTAAFETIADQRSMLFLAVLAGGAIYGLALSLLAGAWVIALEVPLEANRTAGKLCAIYMISQIAKYLPGNVLHFVGRHALGVRAGADHARLLRSSVTEIAGLVCAAGLLLLVSGPWRNQDALPFSGGVPIWVLAVVLVGLCMSAALGLTLWYARRQALRPISLLRIMLKVIPIYILFFLCSGLILWGLCISLGFGLNAPIEIISAASGSWIIGYLTPGAPAGIGVRDASLSILLGRIGPEELAAVSTLAYRLSTLLGDVLAWLAGAAFLWWLRRTEAGTATSP